MIGQDVSASMKLQCMVRAGFLLALAGGAVLLSGCGVTLGAGALSQEPPSNKPPVASQGGGVTMTPAYAALGPGQQVSFHATVAGGGALGWSVDGIADGNSTVGTVSSGGVYTAPASLAKSKNVTITAALSGSPAQDYATSVASIINPGIVLPTRNPQVATYSIYLPAPGKVAIDFGKTTGYGFHTWERATPSANGGEVTVEVAGMLGNTPYHMRANVALDDGATFEDSDHGFTTGTPPRTSAVDAKGMNGQYPQPGIEMWNTILPPGDAQLFATDLTGQVIWTYTDQGTPIDLIQGFQPLSNGHLLLLISYLSSLKSTGSFLDTGTINAVREIDLAGNTIRQLTMEQLNQELAARGYNLTLKSFHHSALELPDGHLVLLATYPKQFTNLPGRPGTTTVMGDVLVDVNQNLQPDWVWNAFDHLDVNRHPMDFPDWTHSNDILYSPEDHDLLLSMRHQNWIIKIDFADGQGSGKVLWRLGEGGDFTLMKNGRVDTNPADWFYAQHGMNFFSASTAGIFTLGLMDNGNDRQFTTGSVLCNPPTATNPANPSCYSTMPVLRINEAARTATLVEHYVPPDTDFSFFGGDAEKLANGDPEVDFCAPLNGALVQELTPDASQVVWQATTPGADQFRTQRLGSLYPGVRWTQASF